jgi:N-methylhydantoinase B
VGGTPGEPGGYLLKRPGERRFAMMAGSHISVPTNAEAIVRTGGGGGWGDPLDRDPAHVADDVAEGIISASAARKLYGVALRRNGLPDESATRRLRARLRSVRKAKGPKRVGRAKGRGR